jgi:hypothetical protein
MWSTKEPRMVHFESTEKIRDRCCKVHVHINTSQFREMFLKSVYLKRQGHLRGHSIGYLDNHNHHFRCGPQKSIRFFQWFSSLGYVMTITTDAVMIIRHMVPWTKWDIYFRSTV